MGPRIDPRDGRAVGQDGNDALGRRGHAERVAQLALERHGRFDREAFGIQKDQRAVGCERRVRAEDQPACPRGICLDVDRAEPAGR